MEKIKKINFPYLLNNGEDGLPKDTVIFFGTDFYNMPIGSDTKLFAQQTNGMLEYIRKNFPNCHRLYQPHPNEKNEASHLNMSGFEIGKRNISDLLLFEQSEKIAGVFAACSWAAGSAYTMGFRSGVFLDLMKGSAAPEILTSYRSYFSGFPDSFFIKSWDQPLPPFPPQDNKKKLEALQEIENSIGEAKTVWFLSSDPAYMVNAGIIAKYLKAKKNIEVGLISVRAKRWDIIDGSPAYQIFDHVFKVKRQGYTADPRKFSAILSNLLEFKRLPIKEGDALISFSHAQFSENCIMSWFKGIKKILLMESRWYHFNYEGEWKNLPQDGFHIHKGVRFSNLFIEPLFGLNKTIYKEYGDGKGVNIQKYNKSLEEVYDAVFVLVPKK